MSYLLDTNVFSETFRENPNKHVLNWFNIIPSESLFLSVLTLGEIRKGIEKLADSKRKKALDVWLEHRIPEWFEVRILPISKEISDRWGYLNAYSKRTLPAIDGLLTATALTHNLKIVTRNTKDFNFLGVEIINPFEE